MLLVYQYRKQDKCVYLGLNQSIIYLIRIKHNQYLKKYDLNGDNIREGGLGYAPFPLHLFHSRWKIESIRKCVALWNFLFFFCSINLQNSLIETT